jgi:hypothetical protein
MHIHDNRQFRVDIKYRVLMKTSINRGKKSTFFKTRSLHVDIKCHELNQLTSRKAFTSQNSSHSLALCLSTKHKRSPQYLISAVKQITRCDINELLTSCSFALFVFCAVTYTILSFTNKRNTLLRCNMHYPNRKAFVVPRLPILLVSV